MNMKNLAWFFMAIFCLAFQTVEYRMVSGLPLPSATFVTTDQIGNVYTVAENQLLKFSPNGKPLQNFSDSKLGELRSIDAGNPMKLLLFYPDMARIIILGTQFSVQSSIELRNIGIQQPTLICNSMNEGYWIYDMQDFQLKKLDLNLQLQFQSGNLMQTTGKRLLPNFLLEADHRVYLNDPLTGVMVFDQFGTYFKNIPILGLRSFQIRGNELLYINQGALKAIDLKLMNERDISIPASRGLKAARISERQLYLLTNDSLNIYSY